LSPDSAVVLTVKFPTRDEFTQETIDRKARFAASYLYLHFGPGITIEHGGRVLDFDPASNEQWSNTIPAKWKERA
jgi:hypothetical protein